MIIWLQEHFLTIMSAGTIFGFGGIYAKHKQHGEHIDELFTKQELSDRNIAEMRVTLARIEGKIDGLIEKRTN